MDIGEILKEIRQSKKLTQVKVSERAKVSQTFLSQLEAGIKNPSKKMLQKLCDLYGIPPIIVLWKATTEKDIQKGKLGIFRKLKPALDAIVDEIIKN